MEPRSTKIKREELLCFMLIPDTDGQSGAARPTDRYRPTDRRCCHRLRNAMLWTPVAPGRAPPGEG